ncbi:MAG: nuclear transport factor 2 family protein [Acidobacteria bacterium]|nr:nuclear transport factor 2 family protein [Acidobacteriota bacterium]
MHPDDVTLLTALEESLWRPSTRFDRDHLARVYADDFDEFGRSGRHWSREASIEAQAEAFEAVLPLPHLRIRAVGSDAALLTYRSETTYPEEGVTLIANRSSLWQRVDGEWRLRFHQGTPTH